MAFQVNSGQPQLMGFWLNNINIAGHSMCIPEK